MSLLDILMPKTKVSEPETHIEGKVIRFGLSKANEYSNTFACRLEGYEEVFVLKLSAFHDVNDIGLVGPGDTLKASGVLVDGVMEDCTVSVDVAGAFRIRFGTSLSVHA